MFFLGGFNTILPHLLYLSIIWVFLIIGYTGHTGLRDSRIKSQQHSPNIAPSKPTQEISFALSGTAYAAALNKNSEFSAFNSIILFLRYPLTIADIRNGYQTKDTSRGPPAF
jgi:hypothetical protein